MGCGSRGLRCVGSVLAFWVVPFVFALLLARNGCDRDWVWGLTDHGAGGPIPSLPLRDSLGRTVLLCEQTLIDRARQRNHEAFGQIVRRYQDRLFNSITHVVRCPAEAEDIVQETFIKAYASLPGFKGKSGLYTWLYRIARNVAASRRQRCRDTLSLDGCRRGATLDVPDPHASVTQRLESAESSDLLHRALGMLSEDFRTILVLREIDGFDYATIARVLEINAGTVRSRLHRARVELTQICFSLEGVQE